MKLVVWITMLLLLGISGQAAILHGSIYDLSLEPVQKAVITVNTTPPQRFVVNNATYAVELEQGDYELEALSQDDLAVLYTREEITILDEDVQYDLILFTDINTSLYDNLDISTEELSFADTSAVWFFVLVSVIIGLLMYVVMNVRRKSQGEQIVIDPNLRYIIELLRKHDSRMLQKDLRKEIGYSEAKLSLELSELEERGIIKKFKKGRGNIIKLV